MDYAALGMKIRRYRHKLGLTQDQLAEKVGISMSYVGHIERGSRKASLDTLVDIANVLDCSVDELLSDSLNRTSTYTVSDDLDDKKRARMRDLLAHIQNSVLLWDREDDEVQDPE